MVIYANGSCSTYTAYIDPDASSSRITFKDDNGDDYIICEMNERDLVLGSGSFGEYFVFDFDFDEQHKKTWNLNDGQYLLQLPALVESSDTPLYAIVRLDNSEFAIAVNSDGEPMATDAELTDIDVASWISGLSRLNIEYILAALLDMEFANISSILDGGIITDTVDTFAIDGTFNPYTDGDDYTPLRIISRFPNGAPIRQLDILQSHEIEVARFNRTPHSYELAGLLKIVAQEGTDEAETVAITKGSDFLGFVGEWGTFVAKIDGSSLKVTDDADVANVWDIDYAGQYKRTLTVDGVGNYGITDIDFLDDPAAQLCLQFGEDTDQSGHMGINIPVETGTDQMLIREPGDTYTFDQTQHAADFVPLIQAIAEMEFGFIGTVATVEVNTATGNGGVDLFTVRDIYARN